MSRKLFFVVIGISGILLGGCASTILSNERITSETAGALGVSPEELTIQNRRTEMTNTYYTAKTKTGKEYTCIINGGNILTAGMINPPMCSKKGEPLKTNPFQK